MEIVEEVSEELPNDGDDEEEDEEKQNDVSSLEEIEEFSPIKTHKNEMQKIDKFDKGDNKNINIQNEFNINVSTEKRYKIEHTPSLSLDALEISTLLKQNNKLKKAADKKRKLRKTEKPRKPRNSDRYIVLSETSRTL